MEKKRSFHYVFLVSFFWVERHWRNVLHGGPFHWRLKAAAAPTRKIRRGGGKLPCAFRFFLTGVVRIGFEFC